MVGGRLTFKGGGPPPPPPPPPPPVAAPPLAGNALNVQGWKSTVFCHPQHTAKQHLMQQVLIVMTASPQLVLRSINSSRSAFASATYHEDFFSAYDMGGATIVQAGVLMKVLR